jgi:hypothetical protein
MTRDEPAHWDAAARWLAEHDPQKPASRRQRMALTITCPECKAKAGQPCPGHPKGFHAARRDLAYQVRRTRKYQATQARRSTR